MVKIEGYEIFAELQRGAWVTLFKAFDLQQQRAVLIKLLNDEHAPQAVHEQLRVESALSGRFLHPNLRRVFASGKFEGRPYLVLEYVEGPTLAELLAQRLPVEFCAWIAKQVAQALSAVHRESIWHRDVKPRNIFISWEGEVKLGDLGLAVEADEAALSLAGTPAYLSPEIVLGQKISAGSDLFALGAVLYEMLTNVPPFADHTTSATLHRIANLEPTPLNKLRPEVPPEIISLCRALLAKTPEARLQDAEAVVAALTHFEQTYRLQTSAARLAFYLQTPEQYTPLEFLQKPEPPLTVSAPQPVYEQASPRKFRRALALFLPTIFVIGIVLFTWGSDKPKKLETTQQNSSAPLPATQEKAGEPIIAAKQNENRSNEKTAPITSARKDSSMLLQNNESSRNLITVLVDSTPSKPENAAAVIAPGAQVWLTSEPRARVFVENKMLGATPLLWTIPQREQVYELRLLAPTLPEVRTLVTAAIIEADTLRVNLWKELSYLEVTVNPWGEIWLDDKPIETTPLVAPIMLTPGLHELAVRHPQLGTRSVRIVLSKGDTLRKAFDLFAQ